MAEPVGIVGTAAGIVSLGLQLYGGLKVYLDDFKSRDDYVVKTLHHLDYLHKLLDSIRLIIPDLENERLVPSQIVAASLYNCEAELKALNGEIQKHALDDEIQKNPRTGAPSDRKGKAKETRKRLLFPFARRELEKLASRVDRVNNLLSIALQFDAL